MAYLIKPCLILKALIDNEFKLFVIHSYITDMVLSIDQWVGKLAVVTGASAGIGAAISKKLVECGIHVTIYLFYLKAINRCFFSGDWSSETTRKSGGNLKNVSKPKRQTVCS